MGGSTIQVTFGEHSAEGLALRTVPAGGADQANVTEGGVVPSAVSWDKDLDAHYRAAAADTGWVADRLELGALIEDAYEVDDDGAAG